MTQLMRVLLLIVVAGALGACEPKVGSDAWCKKMRDTAKSDWSTNDAAEYAKSCVFKSQD